MHGRILLAALTALACACVVIPAAIAGKAPAPTTSAGLLPDLQTTVPAHLNLVNQQQHDYLRFANGIANTGAGHLALRPENVGDITNGIQEIYDADGNIVEEHLASQYEYHPAHNHWHLGDVALFEVRSGSPTGPIVSGNSIKVTFCLIDWITVEGNSNTASAQLLGLRGGHAGHLGGLDRPVPPLARGPAPRPDGRAEQQGPLPRQHRELQREVQGDGPRRTTRRGSSSACRRTRRATASSRRSGNSPCSGDRMCGQDLPNR